MSAGFREGECRRAEFAGGTPLLLPDGQAWRFCEPTARPVSVDGKTAVAFVFGGGLDAGTALALSGAAYRVLRKWGKAETAAQRASCVLEFALLCWGRNYDLPPEAFESIMTAGPISGGLLLRLEAMLLRAVAEASILLPAGAA